MKKTGIYLLSIIIIGIVSFSVLFPAYKMIASGLEGFSAGFSAGYNNEEIIAIGTPIDINFNPEATTIIQPKDSIIFENGKKLPIIINDVSVMVPNENITTSCKWISGLAYFIEIILLFPLIWKFIKFIINISRQNIFVKKNVQLLRQFSWILLAIALLDIVAGITNEYLFHHLSFSMKGYELASNWTIPWSTLLLGCLSMLMAQVWNIGIKIKEEQELTI